MKTTRLSYRIALLLLAALTFASVFRASAQENDSDTIKDLLTSGPWKISFKYGWSLTRIFNKDGTFYTPDRPDENGRWRISGKMIIQTYPDNRQDVFTLPLDAAGTSGIAKDTTPLKAVRDNKPLPPAPTPVPEMNEDARMAATATLTSAPWKVAYLGSTRDLVFNKDSTFLFSGERGRWRISKNVVTLTYLSYTNSSYLFFLPFKQKTLSGADPDGRPLTATLQSTGNPVATGTSASDLLAPNTSTAPIVVPMDDDQRTAAITLLTSGPWKITGGSGYQPYIHIFDQNGTFTTIGSTVRGHWRLSNVAVFLTYADNSKETISLPLIPKGTRGTDPWGMPSNAVLQTAGSSTTTTSSTPRPRSTSTPGVARTKPTPSTAGTPGSTGTPPNYFGTDHTN